MPSEVKWIEDGPASKRLKIDNWRKLRDRLLVMNGNFSMPTWLQMDRSGETASEALEPACGTSACLAGTAYLVERAEKRPDARFRRKIPSQDTVRRAAERWLGLQCGEGSHVFGGRWAYGSIHGVTRTRAIAYVNQVIETSNVYWREGVINDQD